MLKYRNDGTRKLLWIATIVFIVYCIECSLAKKDDKKDKANDATSKLAKVRKKSWIDPDFRWDQMYRFLFTPTRDPIAKQETVVSILSQMLDLQRQNPALMAESSVSRIKKKFLSFQKHMQNKKVLLDSETGLLESLLETFNVRSAMCSDISLKNLGSLVRMLSKFPIHSVLVVNLQEQYKECWLRYVDAMQVLLNLAGNRHLTGLKEVLSQINANPRLILPDLMDFARDESAVDVEKYSAAIAHYLHKKIKSKTPRKRASNFDRLFMESITEPCSLVIALTSATVTQIDRLLGQIGLQQDYIKEDHFKLINLPKMCSIITHHKDISSRAVKMCLNPAKIPKFDPNETITTQPKSAETTLILESMGSIGQIRGIYPNDAATIPINPPTEKSFLDSEGLIIENPQRNMMENFDLHRAASDIDESEKEATEAMLMLGAAPEDDDENWLDSMILDADSNLELRQTSNTDGLSLGWGHELIFNSLPTDPEPTQPSQSRKNP